VAVAHGGPRHCLQPVPIGVGLGRILEHVVATVVGSMSAITGSPMEGRERTVQLIAFAALAVVAILSLIFALL